MENHLAALIDAARSKNPTSFQSAFTNEVNLRIGDRLDSMKSQVVSSILNKN